MALVPKALRGNPIFASTDEDALRMLCAASASLRYKKGELVLKEGELAERVFVLLSGRVRVFLLSPTGDEVVVKLFGPPAVFGESEALANMPFQENVACEEPTELLLMPVEHFRRYLRRCPSATYGLLMDLATRLGISAYNQRSLAFHPSTIRLANYLVDYAEWTNPKGAATWQINLTQDQMAAAIAVTRRSVGKDIAGWREDGILHRRGRGYQVDDPEALMRYTDPDRITVAYSIRPLERED